MLAALAFLALGGLLWLSADGMLADEGVCRERIELAGGRAQLWYPRAAVSYETVEDGDHEHLLTVGGAALALADTCDGSRSLAAEQVRRGVTVLLAGKDVSCAEAWNALRERCGEDVPAAVLAGPARAEEAAALARELREQGEPCAALVLLGDDAAPAAAAEYPGGNTLVLTESRPDSGTLTAFYGSEAGAERGFDGFFGEGTARACAWDRHFGSFARRETMLRVNDWLGSVLGHAVELPDGDLIFAKIIFCRAGAAVLALLCVGTLMTLARRRRT